MSNQIIPPLSVLASWPAPNYVDPVTRGPGLLIANCITSAVAFTLTALRVYTRAFITSTIGLDDVLAVIALIFAIAMCTGNSIANVHFGWGRHQWDVPFDWIVPSLKYRMVFEMTFTVSSCLTKVSLLWFCRRLLGTSAKIKFRYMNMALIAAMVILLLLGFMFIIATMFNCLPLKASFDPFPDYPYHCINGQAMVMGASITNVITDFMTTVVPMPLIWKLQLARRQRLAVIGIFAIGFSVTIASSFRTYYAWMNTYGSYDTSWWGWSCALSAGVEINVGLICASAPALRPLLKELWPRLLGSSGHEGGSSSHRFNSPKSWPPPNRPVNAHMRMASNESMTTKEFAVPRPRETSDKASIVRTVELRTFYENHSETVYGRPVAARSGNKRPFLEARDLKELYEDDETPFALQRMV